MYLKDKLHEMMKMVFDSKPNTNSNNDIAVTYPQHNLRYTMC